jgi:hypothetical protein
MIVLPCAVAFATWRGIVISRTLYRFRFAIPSGLLVSPLTNSSSNLHPLAIDAINFARRAALMDMVSSRETSLQSCRLSRC